jgi:hypothetical protein
MEGFKKRKTKSDIWRKANTALVALSVLLYLVHLASANHDAMQRYELSEFRSKEQELVLEKQNLSVRVAELQSLDRLASESARLKLVKAPAARYVTVPGAVALKQ